MIDNTITEGTRLIVRDIKEEMESAFIDYSMSVITARALPDVRDGLKPVHRRILYAMYEDNLTVDKPPIRSARCWARTIPTATHPYMTRWCVWRRISPCGTRLWRDRETSVLWTATPLPPTVTLRPA